MSGGSSPLARGLPACPHHHVDSGGIIPARAGFTVVLMVAMGSAPDHPRSRGVYGVGVGEEQRECGSSPLARGLPSSPFV